MLLEITDLTVEFRTREGTIRAVDGVDLTVEAGETLGIVGESGSGKTVSSLALLGLLDPSARIVSGSAVFENVDLLKLSERRLLDVRGKRIGMIFQEPTQSLNPTATAGSQLLEAVKTDHYDRWRAGVATGLLRSLRRLVTPSLRRDRESRDKAIDLLQSVHMPAAAEALDRYPFMLSGGMAQRAMIAIALASSPSLLVADEPTTALDVTIQAQIIEILRERKANGDLAMLLITHDLGLIAELCDRVSVMYAGRIVESAPAAELFAAPAHPYTRGLIASMPSLERPTGFLRAMEGSVPRIVGESRAACYFAPRCPIVREVCHRELPPVVPVSSRHTVSCHAFADGPPELPALAPEGSESRPRALMVADRGPIIEIVDLEKRFSTHASRGGRRKGSIRAVDGVSFDIRRGETLALVGESGCGKTTAAEVILFLQQASAGEIALDGKRLSLGSRTAIREARRKMQIVFQNPRSSLNPRMRVRDILLEPLLAEARGMRRLRRQGLVPEAEVGRLLELVGLDQSVASHHPHMLSGGQAQRVAIARSLAVGPELLILDEPTSALDVSVQAQILNVLRRLQTELELSFLFISHDLRVVRNISDRIAVMYLGKIIEIGDTAKVFAAPAHPYTQALLSAIPRADPLIAQDRIILSGDVPSPANIPSGCRFRTRCPIATAICAEEQPELVEIRAGQEAACHFAGVDVRAWLAAGGHEPVGRNRDESSRQQQKEGAHR